VLARSEHAYPLSHPQPGWSEQDPEDWVGAIEAALADLAVGAEGIGFSGQMHGLICLDAAGNVVRPAISGTTSAPARSAPRSRSASDVTGSWN
jgi:xylulokinase